MKLCFVTVGKFKSKPLETQFAQYLRLVSKFVTVEAHELAIARQEELDPKALTRALEKWLGKRGARAHLTLLDERGKLFKSSRDFSAALEKIQDSGFTEWVIAVGGAHGYSEELRQKARLLWSLSPLTMSHELAAAVAAEQLFRGFAILRGHPYHND